MRSRTRIMRSWRKYYFGVWCGLQQGAVEAYGAGMGHIWEEKMEEKRSRIPHSPLIIRAVN